MRKLIIDSIEHELDDGQILQKYDRVPLSQETVKLNDTEFGVAKIPDNHTKITADMASIGMLIAVNEKYPVGVVTGMLVKRTDKVTIKSSGITNTVENLVLSQKLIIEYSSSYSPTKYSNREAWFVDVPGPRNGARNCFEISSQDFNYFKSKGVKINV